MLILQCGPTLRRRYSLFVTYIILPLLVTGLAMTTTTTITCGNDSNALRARIVAAHKAYHAIVFKGMAVTFDSSNTYAIKSRKDFQPLGTVRHIIKGDQTLLLADKKISGSNSDYSFQLAKLNDKYSLTLLEGKRNPSDRIREYESSRRAILSSSIRFFKYGIVELFDHADTKELSIEEAGDRVVVRLSFTPAEGDVLFQNVELELDPSNMYQLLNSRDTMKVLANNQRLEHEKTFTYESQCLKDTELRLMKHMGMVNKYTNSSGKPDEDLYESEYSDWSQEVPDDSQFRLSGYGLPEPSPAALNSGSSWLRWTLISFMASMVLGVLLFRRLGRMALQKN